MEVKGDMVSEGMPSIVMMLVEGGTIALTIMVNSAMALGMNQFVFVAYSNALSSILLLLYSLIFHLDSMKKIFKVKLLFLLFIQGLIGITIGQNVAFTGLKHSSPIVVCAMGLLLPSYQFFINLLLRKTNLNWRIRSTKIKMVGVVVSIIGAITVATYMGPPIIQGGPLYYYPGLLKGPRSLLIFISATTDQWMFGTFLLACSSFFVAIWSMLQVTTYAKFPDTMVVITCYTIFGAIQTAIVDLIANGDLNAWKLKMDLELIIIILTALFGTLVKSRILIWCMNLKGPMFVAMFKPFGIFWACAIGLTFFGSSLHYGSVIGTTIVGVGYLTILWGVKEESQQDQLDHKISTISSSTHLKTPLLQNAHEQV